MLSPATHGRDSAITDFAPPRVELHVMLLIAISGLLLMPLFFEKEEDATQDGSPAGCVCGCFFLFLIAILWAWASTVDSDQRAEKFQQEEIQERQIKEQEARAEAEREQEYKKTHRTVHARIIHVKSYDYFGRMLTVVDEKTQKKYTVPVGICKGIKLRALESFLMKARKGTIIIIEDVSIPKEINTGNLKERTVNEITFK